jgi:hypothetical protein
MDTDKIKKIVNEEIREDCREEAFEILSKSTDSEVEEFIKYHNEDKGNICCLHLDYLKSKLVECNKMTKEGCFGELFTNEDYK